MNGKSEPNLSYREDAEHFNQQGQELAMYGDCQRKNIMFSQMMANMKLQKEIMFAYKLPLFAPLNPNQDALLRPDSTWLSNWSWINDQTGTLSDWSNSLADDTFFTINSFLLYQKKCIINFGREMNLSTTRYWTERLDSPYTYIDNLKLYTDMVSKLYSCTWRAFERTSNLLKKTQRDLAYFMEKAIT